MLSARFSFSSTDEVYTYYLLIYLLHQDCNRPHDSFHPYHDCMHAIANPHMCNFAHTVSVMKWHYIQELKALNVCRYMNTGIKLRVDS